MPITVSHESPALLNLAGAMSFQTGLMEGQLTKTQYRDQQRHLQWQRNFQERQLSANEALGYAKLEKERIDGFTNTLQGLTNTILTEQYRGATISERQADRASQERINANKLKADIDWQNGMLGVYSKRNEQMAADTASREKVAKENQVFQVEQTLLQMSRDITLDAQANQRILDAAEAAGVRQEALEEIRHNNWVKEQNIARENVWRDTKKALWLQLDDNVRRAKVFYNMKEGPSPSLIDEQLSIDQKKAYLNTAIKNGSSAPEEIEAEMEKLLAREKEIAEDVNQLYHDPGIMEKRREKTIGDYTYPVDFINGREQVMYQFGQPSKAAELKKRAFSVAEVLLKDSLSAGVTDTGAAITEALTRGITTTYQMDRVLDTVMNKLPDNRGNDEELEFLGVSQDIADLMGIQRRPAPNPNATPVEPAGWFTPKEGYGDKFFAPVQYVGERISSGAPVTGKDLFDAALNLNPVTEAYRQARSAGRELLDQSTIGQGISRTFGREPKTGKNEISDADMLKGMGKLDAKQKGRLITLSQILGVRELTAEEKKERDLLINIITQGLSTDKTKEKGSAS